MEARGVTPEQRDLCALQVGRGLSSTSMKHREVVLWSQRKLRVPNETWLNEVFSCGIRTLLRWKNGCCTISTYDVRSQGFLDGFVSGIENGRRTTSQPKRRMSTKFGLLARARIGLS